MYKFAVIGDPINHSLSPKIHSIFARIEGLRVQYDAIRVSVDNFESKILELFNNGYQGINVTLPLKEEAYKFCEVRSEESQQSGSINTIWEKSGKFYGDSTDGRGFLNDLSDKEISFQEKNLLLIGSGGSARAILPVIMDRGPKEIKIINRTVENAQALVKEFKNSETKISTGNLFDLVDFKAEGVINTSSEGLLTSEISLPADALSSASWAYDLNYSHEETAFIKHAKERGIDTVADGIGMLINQAALSFEIWTSILPPTSSTLNLLREELHLI